MYLFRAGMPFKFDRLYLCLGFSHSTSCTQALVLLSQQVDVTHTTKFHHRTDLASLEAGSRTPRFNAAVVAWPLSCCGIATPVSLAMHLFNPLGVRSYSESFAVL